MNAFKLPRPANPLIVPPKQEHSQTFILLHGRGDRADAFGAGLLNTSLPDETTLRPIFPGAKFVFLQAPLRPVSVVPGLEYTQWFDVETLRPGGEETDLQIVGLRDTVELVHKTVQREIELVGADNIVLGGLSQGCASSLISLLLWPGPPVAACIGMCGWLPFRKVLEENVYSEEGSITGAQEAEKAVKALATRLAYPATLSPPLVFQKIPIFLGHGVEDNVVEPQLGREAARCLSGLQANVTHKEYPTLDHWYSPTMLQDIVQFLRTESNFKGM